MSADLEFTKANVDFYLKELSKEFRKRGHGAKGEIILVGGASILINYTFRDTTRDIDALYVTSSVLKESINAVSDKLNLPHDWLNNDFTMSASYSSRLFQFSKPYRTYSNVLSIRTINAEYLLAMKLMSVRRYKRDLSDIVGILYEQQLTGNPLTYEKIDKAVVDLYGSWNDISEFAKELLDHLLSSSDLKAEFVHQYENEKEALSILNHIESKYTDLVTKDNMSAIIDMAMKKREKERENNER